VRLPLFATAALVGLFAVALADEPASRDSDSSRDSGGTNNEKAGKFVDLFAGGDLRKHFETTGNWSLSKEGVAHLQPRKGETDWKRYGAYLWLKNEYKDFECEFEYKHEKGGNSGFYFNVTDRQKAVGPVIEVQIKDSAGEEKLSAHGICGGILPGITPTSNAAKPAGQWNKMVVSSLNGEITVKLNGTLVNKTSLTHPKLKSKPKQGFIGFQDHGIPFWLRNVRVRNVSSSTSERKTSLARTALIESVFEKPIRIEADGKPIDVTTGHAAPYVIDFDGDGVRDLLVGQFGNGSFPVSRLPNDPKLRKMSFAQSKVRVYRNLGTNDSPQYKSFEYLKAGNQHASIPST
jgi:hypothetical protein